jgi:hypothetical protein
MFRNCDQAELIIPQLKPLLTGLKTILSSSNVTGTPEAKSFESKMINVIENKICKSKMRFSSSFQEKNDLVASIGDSIDHIILLLRYPVASLKQLIVSCFIAVSKSVLAAKDEELTKKLSTGVENMLKIYFSKKQSAVNSKLFDELILRLADFAIQSIVPATVAALDDSKTQFLLTDAHRIYCSCVKKIPILSAESKIIIESSFDTAIIACISILERQNEEKEKTKFVFKNLKSKNQAVILTTCKEISHGLLSSNLSTVDNDSAKIESLVAILKGFTQEKGSLKSLAEQTNKNFKEYLHKLSKPTSKEVSVDLSVKRKSEETADENETISAAVVSKKKKH